MCLPIGCLKCFVQFQSWITTIIGLTALIGTIVIDVHFKDQLTYVDEITSQKPSEGILIALYVFSSVLICFGLCGIIGSWRRIGTLLFCFNVGNFFLAIAFLGVAIIGFSIGNSTFWVDLFSPSKCYDSDLFPDSASLENVYKEAENVFCQTIYNNQPGCQCYYNQTIDGYNNGAVKYYSAADTSLPIRIQQCKQYTDYQNDYQGDADYLKSVEESFSCSGWCETYPIYVFSDVNSGTPDQSCYGAITGLVLNVANIIGAVAISITCVMILCITCVLCLCFHPTKKQEGNFYSRMAHYD